MAFGTTTFVVTLQKCSHNSDSKLIGTYKGIWTLKDIFEEVHPEVGNRVNYGTFANGDLDLAKDAFGMPPLSPIFSGCKCKVMKMVGKSTHLAIASLF